jgi:hypothetical protein
MLGQVRLMASEITLVRHAAGTVPAAHLSEICIWRFRTKYSLHSHTVAESVGLQSHETGNRIKSNCNIREDGVCFLKRRSSGLPRV